MALCSLCSLFLLSIFKNKDCEATHSYLYQTEESAYRILFICDSFLEWLCVSVGWEEEGRDKSLPQIIHHSVSKKVNKAVRNEQVQVLAY